MKTIDFTSFLNFGKIKFNVNAVYYTELTCTQDKNEDFIETEAHDDIDLYDITFAGESLTSNQENELIQAYGWEQFNTWLLNKGRNAYKQQNSNECLRCWRTRKQKTKTETCRYLNLKKQYNKNGNKCPFFISTN